MHSIPSLASIPLDDVLLAGRAAFLVFSFTVAALTFARWRHVAERDMAHTAERLALVLERIGRLEALVAQSEPRLAALGEQIEMHLKAATAGSAQMSYPIAIRLARAGAEPEELISSCGLTRQEAELVARLHGRNAEPRGQERPPHRFDSAAA